MGVLTESAVHLRDAIVAGRQARAAFRDELERATTARQLQVSSLLGAFAGDLEGVRRAWSGPAADLGQPSLKGSRGWRKPPQPDLANTRGPRRSSRRPSPTYKKQKKH